jgi:hypothetical protein
LQALGALQPGPDLADEPSLPCVRGLHVGEPDVHRRAVVRGPARAQIVAEIDRIEGELTGQSR